jgi:hypothetical protein
MLLWYELKKILRAPAVVGFLIVCLGLNTLLVLVSFDVSFDETAQKPENVFAGLQAREIADYYAGQYALSARYEQMLRGKYDKLQPVVEEKAQNGDALSVYLGAGTTYYHRLLFGTLFGAILLESGILALLAALFSAGFEQARGTEGIVAAGEVGRRVTRTKLLASLLASATLFALIAAVTLAVTHARFDYASAWRENVSSMFNRAAGAPFPFITWESRTVLQYLWAEIGVSLGFVACLCLFGFAVGVSVRSQWAAFLTAGVTLVMMFMAQELSGVGSLLASVLYLTPVGLWRTSGYWFTDGGAGILWKNFEHWGLAVSAVVFAAASAAAVMWYRKRDLP